MKWAAWQKAFEQSRIAHSWAPLRVIAGDHVAELRVSADAVKVIQDGERIRETAGAFAYQLIADRLDALMPTAKLVEMRHAAATVKVDPMVAPLIKSGGTVDNVRAAEASAAIDSAIQKSTDVRPGDWLVSNVGKHFVLDKQCDQAIAVNHGFVVRQGDCRANLWRGTPTMESVALGPAWRVIQRRGAAHTFGPKTDQDDYSQTVVLVHRRCLLDGIEVDTSRLYTEFALAQLALHDGLPLRFSRHPNVPEEARPVAVAVPSTLPPPAGPSRTSEPPPVPFVELPAVKTPAAPQEVYEALARAWRKQLGAEPKRESLLVLLSQWAFETGRGSAMWCYNLGNAKGKPDGADNRHWTFFACNELLPVAQANALVAKAGMRRDGGPGSNVAVTSIKDGIATVWFYPSHPVCCFRAYLSLDDGADDYFAMMHKRFASAWPAVEAGNPSAFSHALKLARYYTAEESHYTRSLVSIYSELAAKVGLVSV